MPLSFRANFDPMISELDREVGELDRGVFANQGRVGSLIQKIVSIVRSFTPRKSGELSKSTEGTLEDETPGAVKFVISQPALSLPNEDMTGGGHYYVGWVVLGRGPIDISKPGPYSTGKKALAHRPDFGPVKRVGPAAPNPYPSKASPEIMTAVRVMAEHWSDDILSFLYAEPV